MKHKLLGNWGWNKPYKSNTKKYKDKDDIEWEETKLENGMKISISEPIMLTPFSNPEYFKNPKEYTEDQMHSYSRYVINKYNLWQMGINLVESFPEWKKRQEKKIWD